MNTFLKLYPFKKQVYTVLLRKGNNVFIFIPRGIPFLHQFNLALEILQKAGILQYSTVQPLASLPALNQK